MSEDTTQYLVDAPSPVSGDDNSAGAKGWARHTLMVSDQMGKTVGLCTLSFLTRESMTDDALIGVIRDAAQAWVRESEAGRALFAATRGHISVERLLAVDDDDLRAKLADLGVVPQPGVRTLRVAALPLTGNLLRWRGTTQR